MKTFRSLSRDRWKRRRCWFPNGCRPFYKSTPRGCLVGLCAPQAVLTVVYFWFGSFRSEHGDATEYIPSSGSSASLNLNADYARDREMRNSGRLFDSRVVSRDATAIFTARQLRAVPRCLFQDRVVEFKITVSHLGAARVNSFTLTRDFITCRNVWNKLFTIFIIIYTHRIINNTSGCVELYTILIISGEQIVSKHSYF